MALSATDIDATDGGESANSYDTLANANAYFQMRPDSAAWKDADVSERVGAMLFATVLIERETYYARKAADAQALSFPLQAQSAVPLKVKHAQFEQALDLLRGDWVQREEFRELQSTGVRQLTTRETQTRMVPATPDGYPAYSLCRAARELLLGFMDSSVVLGRA